MTAGTESFQVILLTFKNYHL